MHPESSGIPPGISRYRHRRSGFRVPLPHYHSIGFQRFQRTGGIGPLHDRNRPDQHGSIPVHAARRQQELFRRRDRGKIRITVENIKYRRKHIRKPIQFAVEYPPERPAGIITDGPAQLIHIVDPGFLHGIGDKGAQFRSVGNGTGSAGGLRQFQYGREFFPTLIGDPEYFAIQITGDIGFTDLTSGSQFFSPASPDDRLLQRVQTALTRLAQNIPPLLNRAYYDCNPPGKNHWSYRLFVEKCDPVSRKKLPYPEDYAAMRINPDANRENLPAGYIEYTLGSLPERQKNRFLAGEWADDLAGALWNWTMIDPYRVTEVPELISTVIAVDPAVNSGKECDTTGIIAAACGRDGDFYILEDRSMQSSPVVWVRRVIEMYHRLRADRVIVEVNNGGELFSALFASEDDSVRVEPVRAVRDKFSRAEPVAAFYEKGMVHHLGVFPELEQEMCAYQPGIYTSSPDRMDAMVWAVTGLAADRRRSSDRFILS